MQPYYKITCDKKFGENFNFSMENLQKMMDSLEIDSKKGGEIKFTKLIDYLKSGKSIKILKIVKKISFLTGAGISTTAGIPDFRSESGLFKSLQTKYGLETPEQFFSIDFFCKKPELFYDFAKNFDAGKFKPTPTHVL